MQRLQRLQQHLLPNSTNCAKSLRAQATASKLSVSGFLQAPHGFAVVGASAERQKFGNKVLRCYLQHGLSAVPVSLTQTVIEGLPCISSLKDLGRDAEHYGVSVITPPKVTLQLLDLAKELKIQRLWLQPGSESPEVLQRAEELQLGLIHSGPCLLVELGFDPQWIPPQASASGEAAEGAVRWRLCGASQVFTVTLAAPKTRNALSRPVLSALKELLQTLPSSTRVLLLESQGSVFSSGHRFGDFAAELGAAEHRRTLQLCSEVNMLLREVAPPSIAVVQGLATAAGCQLACSCDLVLAADTAAFQLPGAANGGFCHTPAVAVAQRTSASAVAEMAFLAEKIPAERAERLGLVNRVIPRAKLYSEARKVAEKIAKADPAQIQRGKQVLYQQMLKPTLAEKYACAEPAMLEMFSTPASQEMVKKFQR
ncbi:Enoyl-CoA hydratase domain-containing protein 3 [Durusdinium trenchii]|uniref:Mitochondrial n=1 Tax=Durusdinium trenchii TaxID=1381693 RepID=A0ABP0MEY5_9DINO